VFWLRRRIRVKVSELMIRKEELSCLFLKDDNVKMKEFENKIFESFNVSMDLNKRNILIFKIIRLHLKLK